MQKKKPRESKGVLVDDTQFMNMSSSVQQQRRKEEQRKEEEKQKEIKKQQEELKRQQDEFRRIEELRQNRRDSYKRREGQSKENTYYHQSREAQHSKEKGWIKPTQKPQTITESSKSFYTTEKEVKYLDRTYTANSNAVRRKVDAKN